MPNAVRAKTEPNTAWPFCKAEPSYVPRARQLRSWLVSTSVAHYLACAARTMTTRGP
jgi:hypothetical protein